MSWSTSISGTHDEIRALLSALPARIEEADRRYSTSDKVIADHQRQIKDVTAVVEKLLEVAPEGYRVSGSVSGSSNGESGTIGVSLSYYKPAEVIKTSDAGEGAES